MHERDTREPVSRRYIYRVRETFGDLPTIKIGRVEVFFEDQLASAHVGAFQFLGVRVTSVDLRFGICAAGFLVYSAAGLRTVVIIKLYEVE